jgi:hypothetical protein
MMIVKMSICKCGMTIDGNGHEGKHLEITLWGIRCKYCGRWLKQEWVCTICGIVTKEYRRNCMDEDCIRMGEEKRIRERGGLTYDEYVECWVFDKWKRERDKEIRKYGW